MTSPDHVETRREAVAVYQTANSLRAALRSLKRVGFDRARVTLVADEVVAHEKLGPNSAKTVDVAQPLVDPRARFILERHGSDHFAALLGAGIAYVGAAIAAIGAVSGNHYIVVPALIGTLLCGAAAIAMTAASGRLSNPALDLLAKRFRRGEFLLWVQIESPEQEAKALKVLSKSSVQDVQVFDIPEAA
ncbi:MAG: hypothetical protein ACM3N5_09395 [Candidatus Eiseniibacteriota bacterium]